MFELIILAALVLSLFFLLPFFLKRNKWLLFHFILSNISLIALTFYVYSQLPGAPGESIILVFILRGTFGALWLGTFFSYCIHNITLFKLDDD